MKLQNKTILILGPAYVLFGAALIFLARSLLLAHFERQEREELVRDTRRLDERFDLEYRYLQAHATTLACWDEAVNYLKNPNPDFDDNYLSPPAMDNMGADLAVFLKANGHMVALRFQGAPEGPPAPNGLMTSNLNENLPWLIDAGRPFNHGLFSLAGQLYLIAKAPVLPSSREGEPSGFLILGRRLSANFFGSLNVDPSITFQYWPEEKKISALTKPDGSMFSVTASRIANYALYRDASGYPALLAKIEKPRTIYLEARQTINHFVWVLAVGGLLIWLTVSHLLRAVIINRVLLINRMCQQIATRGAVSLPLPETGHDELGEMGAAINQMLRSLEATNRARESIERKFLTLVEKAHIGVYQIAPARYVYVNQAFCQMLGYTAQEMFAMEDPIVMIAPEDQEMVRDNLAKRWNGELEELRYVARMRRKDGSMFSAELYGHRVVTDGEATIHGVLQDISSRLAAEEAGRSQRNFLQIMLESLPLAVFAKRASDGRYVLWNSRCEQLFGLGRDNALNQLAEEVFGSELAQLENDEDETVLAERRALTIPEIMISLPKAGPRVLHKIKVPVFDEANRPVYVLGIAEDITERVIARQERQKIEERMQETQKLESLGVLAGGIAHDFNNLLVSILGNIQLAKARMPEQTPPLSFLPNAELAVQRAAELCRQLLAYAGKGSFQIQRVGLAGVISEMVTLLDISIGHRAVMEVEIQDGLPQIECDLTQIRQVIMNLITNAADAMEPGEGIISVRVGWQEAPDLNAAADLMLGEEPAGKAVWIEVRDEGRGIENDALSKIFDPFYTTKMVGRGLGLAAVQGIVRSQRGAIHVSSRPGHGSRFRIIFPAAPEEPAAEKPVVETAIPPAEKPAAARAREEDAPHAPQRAALPEDNEAALAPAGLAKILIIDDEDAVREVTEDILRSMEFFPVSAADGKAGLEIFAQQPDIELVLLDLTMPEMGGEEVYSRLTALRPETPVLLMSGYSEEDILSRFTGIKPAGFLQKPYLLEDLSEKINAALRHAATQ